MEKQICALQPDMCELFLVPPKKRGAAQSPSLSTQTQTLLGKHESFFFFSRQIYSIFFIKRKMFRLGFFFFFCFAIYVFFFSLEEHQLDLEIFVCVVTKNLEFLGEGGINYQQYFH